MIKLIPEVIDVAGRKRVKVTLYDGEQILDADVIDPLNAGQRRKLAQRLAERSGDAHAAERIEQALLQSVELIAEAAKRAKEEDAGTDADRPGDQPLGPVTVVRPELFLTREVVALSVPEVVIRNREPVGRWRIYLRYADGRRECKSLPQTLALEDQRSLWIHPQPAAPLPPVTCAWSAESRQRFLDGTDDPAPRAVFLDLVGVFEGFLDLPDDAELPIAHCQLPIEGAADGAGATSDASPSIPLGNGQSAIGNPCPSPAAITLACWTMLTYCYPAFDAVPYLYVGGPAGSGKTRVFEILSRVAFRPLGSSNLSAAALFRTLHDRGGTLLLDEAERLTEGSPEVAEIRSILLAGYKRGGRASRLESAGDGANYAMTEFHVFGPKAIACITGVDGALATRCIPLHMFRSAPDSPKPRRRLDHDPTRWTKLSDALHHLALTQLGACAPALADQEDLCPLHGRNHELWQPLFALASFVDPDGAMGLLERLTAYARKLIDDNKEQLIPDQDLTALRVLTEKLLNGHEPNCATVLQGCRQVSEPAFRQMTATRLSYILRRYGLKTQRMSAGRAYPLDTLAQIERIEKSYGIDVRATENARLAVVNPRGY